VASGGARGGDDVVGVALAEARLADLRLAQAGFLDQRRRGQAARVAENARRRLEAVRLPRLAQDPGLAHSLDNRVGLVQVELELGTKVYGVVEVAGVFAEAQLLVLAQDGVVRAIEHLDAADVAADFPAAVAGVDAQRAADGGRDADERFEPREVVPDRLADQRREGRPTAGAHASAVDLDFAERRCAQPQDDALPASLPAAHGAAHP